MPGFTVDDETGLLTPSEEQAIRDFIRILHTGSELDFLDNVTIANEPKRHDGWWNFLEEIAPDANGKFTEPFVATIGLNQLRVPDIGDKLRVLAHEYGHHYTFCHWLRKETWLNWPRPNMWTAHLPDAYYHARGLPVRSFDVNHRGPGRWLRSEKELIAEDYRVTYACSPMNTAHGIQDLTPPYDAMVRDYLEKLGR